MPDAALLARIATLEQRCESYEITHCHAVEREVRNRERVATLEASLGECVTKAAGMIGTDAEMAAGPNHGVVLAALDWLHGQKATLEAELAASRMDAEQGWREAHMMVATANALRDALEGLPCAPWCATSHEMHARCDCQRKALSATPAQSLAAHDAEVLERAATCAEAFLWNLPAIQSQVGANCGDAIRALAAQEVKP